MSHSRFYDADGQFNFQELARVTTLVTRFLDDVGSVNTFPNEQFKTWYDENRPIGIGIMGYADALLKLGMMYGKKPALSFLGQIMSKIKETSYNASYFLGKEKGVPSNCVLFGRRNITTVSIAPTGSIAVIAGCSHSTEPIYSPDYTRVDERGQTYHEIHPLANEPYFTSVVGHLNSPTLKEHIDVVIVAQLFTDAGVSKTCNAPENTTVQEIYDALVYAWENGCKGITVYRDNSRTVQVLSHNKPAVIEEVVEICERTGKPHRLVKTEGCSTCLDCGFSFCSV